MTDSDDDVFRIANHSDLNSDILGGVYEESHNSEPALSTAESPTT